MIDVTGIELGPDCCVLVRAGSDPSRTTVTAARAVMSGEWSDDHEALTTLLRSAKRTNRLSPHARVVAWGLPESGASADLAHLPELGPLVAAGFEIDSIVSPVRALADLVRARRELVKGDGVAALSLNTHGAAIAIVSRGEVIASRVFDWPLGRPFTGAHPEELERYLVVSEIAPELRHLIDLVRPVHGVTVTSVVICGNLPELRSLSMLLIDEMDLEVETLDSVDLLDPEGTTRLADLVPTLQLAALAATPREGSPTVTDDRSGSGSALATFTTMAAMILLATWSALAVTGSSPATPLFPGGLEVAALERPVVPDIVVEGTIGRVDLGNSEVRTFGSSKVLGLGSDLPKPRASDLPSSKVRALGSNLPKPRASELPSVPAVSGVLISGDRRIAILDGRIVSLGDRVGPLRVMGIDRSGVVLREPGGREIQVAIRTRKPPPPDP